MKRRGFIKNAGVLTSSMFLSNELLAAGSFVAGPKIRVAIIGCGDRGVGIMNVMKQLPEQFEIRAICDVLDFRLQNALKVYTSRDLKSYKDYREVLDDKAVDAVFIATPLNMHFEIAQNAIRAEKHVYLEKTMTYNANQAFELIEIKKKYPAKVLQVGHQYRSSPLYYKVKEMIDAGYLGKVTQIDCRWDRNGNWRRSVPHPSLERQVNWRMYKEYSGGLAAELLSHQIDFINWAFNTQPDQIYATGGIDFYKDGRETFDNIQATLRYEKEGMIGNFGATCSNKRDGYLFKIKGSKGTISLLMNQGMFYTEELNSKLEVVDGVTGATKITWNKDGGAPILPEPTKDGTWYALKEFYSSIITNKIPDSNIYTGTKTAIAVDLINKSSYSNTIQNWLPEYNRFDRG
ncbi:Gfo/Idh/MocA family protein [Paradesertivirga mongoliensis]|uniref:Gfo/Idh/MocA family protein n=1 Tax=Paradesertivirga mongoliensis TaxID=2100740 RepID=A0ABW4ZFY9_9SPHI|nr:Gfo/Idh/MocA family oxidoreductase [Pedobacter mongoliensis]